MSAAARTQAIAVVGPSGSGKTTLLNNLFPNFHGSVAQSSRAVTRKVERKSIDGWTVIDTPGNDIEDRNFPELSAFDDVCVLVVLTRRYADAFKKFQAKYPDYSLLCVRGYGIERQVDERVPSYSIDVAAPDFPHLAVIRAHCRPVTRTNGFRQSPAPEAARSASSGGTPPAACSEVCVVDIKTPHWTLPEFYKELSKTDLSREDIEKHHDYGDAILLVALRKRGFPPSVVNTYKGNDALRKFAREHDALWRKITSAFESDKIDQLKDQTIGNCVETLFAFGALRKEEDVVQSRKRKRKVGGFLLARYLDWVGARAHRHADEQ